MSRPLPVWLALLLLTLVVQVVLAAASTVTLSVEGMT